MALSNATLETLTKLVSLKERIELIKGKLSDIKRYLFAGKVAPYHLWTGIAQLRTLRSAYNVGMALGSGLFYISRNPEVKSPIKRRCRISFHVRCPNLQIMCNR